MIDAWPVDRAFSSDGPTCIPVPHSLERKGVEGKIVGFSESCCLWVRRVGQKLGIVID